jgi:ribosomal protein S18 acetylase RimI-like enzyme
MNAEPVTFSEFDDPPEAAARAVDAGLDRHNHAAAPLGGVKPLACFASDVSGETVGGAIGRTWGACCELQQLWVDAAYRSRGIASRLLRQFERRAGERGCSVFYLTTLSFQAPAFYRKRGYATLAEIAGYPDGITKHLMHKVVPATPLREGEGGLRDSPPG